MRVFTDLTGQVFSRLTVQERIENAESGDIRWKCLCECGNETVTTSSRLTGLYTRSCGCLKKFKTTTHGLGNTRQYSIWDGIRQRCDNPAATHYAHYGGRGITYDPRWKLFVNFWEDMEEGYADNLTIDRIDNSKGYYKENCRWVTKSAQGHNKRKMPGCKNEYIGVDEGTGGNFYARYKTRGRKKHLGTFPTALQAAQAYDDAVEPIIGTRPNGKTKDA